MTSSRTTKTTPLPITETTALLPQRATHSAHGLFWSAVPRRAAVEVLLFVALGLVLIVVGVRSDTAEMLIGSAVLGEAVALLLALRLRWQQTSREAWAAAAVALLMVLFYFVIGLIAAGSNGSAFVLLGLEGLIATIVFGFGLPTLHAVSYLLFRAVLRIVLWWNTIRQRRLLWALTNDQLTIVLVLMVV